MSISLHFVGAQPLHEGSLLLGVVLLFLQWVQVQGGIGQSFLALNKFSEADPVLGQGVPSQTGALGMSLSGGGLES